MDKNKNEKSHKEKTFRREKKDMLSVKELVRNKSDKERKDLSPLDAALERFKKENGYSFDEMIENSKIRRKHNLKQMQKPEYNDNDFLDQFQSKQGD